MDNKQILSNSPKSEDQSETRNASPTKEMVQDWLTEHLADYLKILPDKIDITEPISRYGVDSSVAVTLTGELGEWLGLTLAPTLFWEYTTIESLAHHLMEECQQTQSGSE